MLDANIKITEEELGKLGHQHSIALADGSGYLAELGAYHELHCIVILLLTSRCEADKILIET